MELAVTVLVLVLIVLILLVLREGAAEADYIFPAAHSKEPGRHKHRK